MLVLTMSHNARPHPIQENGVPIWAVVSAVVDGDTMKVALMLERSSRPSSVGLTGPARSNRTSAY